jgi:hypothetical protein
LLLSIAIAPTLANVTLPENVSIMRIRLTKHTAKTRTKIEHYSSRRPVEALIVDTAALMAHPLGKASMDVWIFRRGEPALEGR